MTAQLKLRPPTSGDLDPLHALRADPEVMRFSAYGADPSRAYTAARLGEPEEHWSAHGDGCWMFVDLAPGELVGWGGIQQDPQRGPQFEIFIARRAWGKGLATEAGRACIDHVRNGRSLVRVLALSDPENLAARRVLAKLGFRFDRPIEHDAGDRQLFILD